MSAEIYLSGEHENHHALFNRVLSGEHSTFPELRTALIRHVRLEEEYLFERALKKPELEDVVRFAWEEHNLIMDLLQRIDEKKMGSPSWVSKVRLLERIHSNHTRYEETILFPLLTAFFNESDLTEIAESMKAHRHNKDPEKILYPERPGSHQMN